MITRRVRFPRPRKPVEQIPTLAEYPTDPVILHEDGMWAVWYDDVRYPSHAFARAAWLQRRHRDAGCDA